MLKAALTLAALALALPAAAKPITDDQVAGLRICATTVADVLARFGRPTTLEKSADGGEVLTYSMTHARTKAVSFVPVVGMFAGGSVSESTRHRFEFEPDGKLTSASATTTEIECRTIGGCGPWRLRLAVTGVGPALARHPKRDAPGHGRRVACGLPSGGGAAPDHS
jgi:hypothetical protein